jgi:hypothetical protein
VSRSHQHPPACNTRIRHLIAVAVRLTLLRKCVNNTEELIKNAMTSALSRCAPKKLQVACFRFATWKLHRYGQTISTIRFMIVGISFFEHTLLFVVWQIFWKDQSDESTGTVFVIRSRSNLACVANNCRDLKTIVVNKNTTNTLRIAATNPDIFSSLKRGEFLLSRA